MRPPRTIDLATSVGLARALVWGSRSGTTLVLGHGAGGGVEAGDLQATASAVVAARLGLVLVEQPWRVAGRKVAPRPAALDSAWIDVLGSLGLRGTVVLGGRSAGARVACRTATALGAAGVVALCFPLHPPGRPERSRADELAELRVPLLVVQGERDPFGRPAEVALAAPAARLHVVPGADHALRCGSEAKATQAARREAAGAVVDFLTTFGE